MRKIVALALLINLVLVSTALAAPTSNSAKRTVIGELVRAVPEQVIKTDPAKTNTSGTTGATGTSTANSTTKPAGTASTTTANSGQTATTTIPANLVINSDGQLFKFDISPLAELLIDGVPVKVNDLKAGLEVKVQIEGQQVISLESYSNEKPGYINQSSRTQIGTVIGFDASLGEVDIRFADDQISIPVTPDILVTEKGQNISRSQLSAGDKVKLIYDEYGDLSRIEVEGRSVLIKDLIRGRLRSSDILSGKVNLQSVKTFRNGQWVEYTGMLQLPFDNKVPIYMGSKLIPAQNLKYYSGKDVYAVLSTALGRDYIKKMVIKPGNERVYTSTIYEFSWDQDSFDMFSSSNISFNEGTIIIQNGRLIDIEALDNRCQAMVIAGGTSERLTASVISVLGQGLNSSPLGDFHLYCGHLYELQNNDLKLSSVNNLDSNRWGSGGEYEFSYGDDTTIYDINGQKFITARQFLNGDYDEYNAYLYAEGDNAVAMAIQRQTIHYYDDNTSYGTISAMTNSDTLGWTMTLTNMCDWSSEDSAWRDRDSDAEINLATALIIKSNQKLDASSLTEGDRVFIVRTGYRAKIVIVK
ncbi:MAG: hypothetical protein ACM3PE_02740 [Deltaproteobacteria bacterium]